LWTSSAPQTAGPVGTVHHIAWRTADDEQQGEWHREIAKRGYNISTVMDRKYFHSVYFREPGGVPALGRDWFCQIGWKRAETILKLVYRLFDCQRVIPQGQYE
jgi:hypothetical protein